MNTINKSGSIVNCEKCNKEFYKNPSWLAKGNRHFCSIVCRNKTIKKPCIHPKKTCFNCGKNLRHSNKTNYCQNCHRIELNTELKNTTLREFQNKESVKGKHPSWVNSNVRNLCRSWNSNLISNPCQYCGYDKHTEFCHIKGISEFDLDTPLKIVNAPENILMLCPNHHWEFDNGFILIEQIKPRVARDTGVEPVFSIPFTAKNLEDSPD